jgi:NAD(P)-dependent dehydrogenase (short-subunit alcohol dehydrogenase family)
MQTPKDRIALVTGANKGIGFEIARQLGQEGHHILIGARDRGRGQSAVAELGSKGFAARFVQIDLTKLDTIVGAAADIEAQEGRLDILINNAGIRRCVCAIRAMQTIHRSSRTLRFYNRLRHGPR